MVTSLTTTGTPTPSTEIERSRHPGSQAPVSSVSVDVPAGNGPTRTVWSPTTVRTPRTTVAPADGESAVTAIRSPAIRRTGDGGATRSAAAAPVVPPPSHCSGQVPTRPSLEESTATTVPELGTATRPTAMA